MLFTLDSCPSIYSGELVRGPTLDLLVRRQAGFETALAVSARWLKVSGAKGNQENQGYPCGVVLSGPQRANHINGLHTAWEVIFG
jgi:hypothetical protein